MIGVDARHAGRPLLLAVTVGMAGRPAGRRLAAGRAAGAAPPLRSAVSATIADCTPGIALTASSARFRTDSQACTTPASTVIEKNTLPSVATMSDSAPVFGSGVPSGAATLLKRR